MNQPLHNARSAFSLIELSVVLIIVAVIIAGILAGQNLLRGSRVVAVVQDADRYKSAFLAFYEKYQQIPGDMHDAYNYFDPSGTNAKCGNLGIVTAAVGNCNGDGDGAINNGITNGYVESLRAWQHLQLAGLVEGRFTGATGTTRYQPGTNLPASKLAGSPGYNLATFPTTATAIYGFMGHFMTLATPNTSTTFDGAGLSVPDAVMVDQKLDDGVAATGTVLAQDSAATTNCVDGSNVYVMDESLNLGATTAQCKMNFLLKQAY